MALRLSVMVFHFRADGSEFLCFRFLGETLAIRNYLFFGLSAHFIGGKDGTFFA